MVELVVSSDNFDTRLGIFFAMCRVGLTNSLNGIEGLELQFIRANQLTQAYYDFFIPTIVKPFIKVVYSHGTSNTLVNSQNEAFVIGTVNSLLFEGTLFYTFSCETGKDLGQNCVIEGCRVYIGYSKRIHVITGFFPEFVDCANQGLVHFLTTGSSARDAVESMKEMYLDVAFRVANINYLAASTLRRNRACLVLHGDGSLTSSDFEK